MIGQALKDRRSPPVRIIFSENRLTGYSFVGFGVLPAGINAFKSGGKLRTQSGRTGGSSDG